MIEKATCECIDSLGLETRMGSWDDETGSACPLLVFQTSHCLKPLAKIVSGDGQNRWIASHSSTVGKLVNSIPITRNSILYRRMGHVSVTEHFV